MANHPLTKYPLQYIIINGRKQSIPFTPVLEELPVTSGLSHYLAVDPETGNVYRQLGTSNGGGNGASYLNELLDVSISNSQNGDMLVFQGGQWRKLETKFVELTLDQGNVAIWDLGQWSLNRKIETSNSFTLALDSPQQGQMGHVIITVPPSPTAYVTINLDFFGDLPNVIRGKGSLDGLGSGVYHLCWVYDGYHFSYNIAGYDFIDIVEP